MDSGQLRIPLFLLSSFQEALISTGIYMVLGKLGCDFIDVPTRVEHVNYAMSITLDLGR